MTSPVGFRIDWVLVNELAIGHAPRQERHLVLLKAAGVRAILSLCSAEEAPPPGLRARFRCERLVLPAHGSGRLPLAIKLEEALKLLTLLKLAGPVYVHCVAAMERSPLLYLAWLIRERRLSIEQALAYLMHIHPGANPLPGQLALLRRLSQNFWR
ncbi:MAG TPA: phosphatase [Synechococcales bacterium UBA10510]|nr:phosphatase [Synechococcales bacterium UBA10510]